MNQRAKRVRFNPARSPTKSVQGAAPRALNVFFLLLAASALCTATDSALAVNSMTAQFEDHLATQEWERTYTESNPEWRLPDGTFLPFQMRIRDLDTGKEADLKAAVAYDVEARRRWGGQSLGVDWVLVLDQATDTVQRTIASVQLKSKEQRVLQFEIGPRMDMTGWSLHTSGAVTRIERSVAETSDTLATPLGAQGERARAPFGVAEGPRFALLAGVDPAEPRLFQVIARPDDPFFGIRFETALSPQTTTFSNRAVFHCVFAAWPRGSGAYAFEHATDVWPLLWPTRSIAGSTTNSEDAASITSTPFPLIFSPRIRTEHDLTEQSSWALHAIPTAEPNALETLESLLDSQALEDLGNFARDARVKISVDSTEPGASAEALADGVTSFATNIPSSIGWRTADTATTHRVTVDLPHPTSLSELRLHWPVVEGNPQVAQELRIECRMATDEAVEIPFPKGAEPAPLTRIVLPSVQIRRLTLEMPPGAGPSGSSNQLWLCEMELR